MSKHTQGEWHFEGNPDQGWIVYNPRLYRICEVFDTNSFPKNRANAHLISAAPELLEAVQIALDYALYADPDPDDLALIKAAIAKATGEPQ